MGAQSSALTAAVNTLGTAGSAYCFAIYASDTGFDPCRLPEGDSSPVLFLSALPTSTLLASKAIELAVRPGPHKIFQLLGMAPSASSSSNPQCPGAEFEGFHRFLQLIAGNETIKSQLLNQTLVEYGRAVTDIPKGAASVNVDLTINSTATAARTMPFFCQNGASPAGGVVLQNGNGTGTEFVSTESDSSLAQDFVLPFEAAPKLKSISLMAKATAAVSVELKVYAGKVVNRSFTPSTLLGSASASVSSGTNRAPVVFTFLSPIQLTENEDYTFFLASATQSIYFLMHPATASGVPGAPNFGPLKGGLVNRCSGTVPSVDSCSSQTSQLDMRFETTN